MRNRCSALVPAPLTLWVLPLVCLASTALGASARLPVAAASAAELEKGFNGTVKPFVQAYCVECHGGKKPEAELDLSAFTSLASIAKDMARWDQVLERVEAGEMPPDDAKKQPAAGERAQLVTWLKSMHAAEVRKNAGDPGFVLARRLSNAEYDYTIRDLTGVDIRPTKEFPVDPANEAGFDNSGESLAMSPSLVKKYLDAARNVADHLVFTPDGFTFAPYTVTSDDDRTKYAVNRVVDFYKRQSIDFADFFVAAWRFQHRAALGKRSATLADFAKEAKISPKYLGAIWETLNAKGEDVGPIAAVQKRWRDLPAPAAGKEPDAVRTSCVELRDFVGKLRPLVKMEFQNLVPNGRIIALGSQTMVLWKDQQYAANRRNYAGNAQKVDLSKFVATDPLMKIPAESAGQARYEEAFKRFCAVFPDAFYISERSRMYLTNARDIVSDLRGHRLLTAGFHSQMGFFRDDQPLMEMVLDDAQRRELDRLWAELDFITQAPIEQFKQFIWFERAEPPSIMVDPAFAPFRAEDGDLVSEAKIKRLAEVYYSRAEKMTLTDTPRGGRGNQGNFAGRGFGRGRGAAPGAAATPIAPTTAAATTPEIPATVVANADPAAANNAATATAPAATVTPNTAATPPTLAVANADPAAPNVAAPATAANATVAANADQGGRGNNNNVALPFLAAPATVAIPALPPEATAASAAANVRTAATATNATTTPAAVADASTAAPGTTAAGTPPAPSAAASATRAAADAVATVTPANPAAADVTPAAALTTPAASTTPATPVVTKLDEPALAAIRNYFIEMNARIRALEQLQPKAEPAQLKALVAFAERASRRPLATAEKDDLLAFYRSLREQKLSHEDAIRDSVVSVLMSPAFTYRVDLPKRNIASARPVQPLSDYELANRLSYFLWSSMPDAELLAHAAAGDLHRPEVMAAQARRMLQDNRVRGFATEFAGNWLDVRRFEEHNAVDRERFATFTNELRTAMFEEPIRFTVDLIQRNGSVLDFVYGQHTFVNGLLAKHYGMPEPAKPEDWVRVDNAKNFQRGGLLPMAVFLTKNAPGLRTSPVKRGNWVVSKLLGERIPPPPPNVPVLPTDETKLGNLTLRETLARHREDKACASCHNKIDSFGLVFEGFGPVGEVRKTDLAGRPTETTAKFPDGSEGTGLDGLQTYIRTKVEHEFIDNLCRKLMVYALGRSLIPSDDLVIDAMRQKLSTGGYRFNTIVEELVTSPQFLNKRISSNLAKL